jgi:hypothetical protein
MTLKAITQDGTWLPASVSQKQQQPLPFPTPQQPQLLYFEIRWFLNKCFCYDCVSQFGVVVKIRKKKEFEGLFYNFFR